ncbi:hypothetical protein G3O08_15605 [Cryomorpha ignava]|uniref:DUF4861 domain-containing protein n=1 Tax=Cryomorpha ignava TaxID=101383 RepID=A0A7K3WTW8_9FLAO|nr:hypothetical protein [Cryomorpha ignava]NEN24926.1 hypothetical protein [Cryomorpha ignava]
MKTKFIISVTILFLISAFSTLRGQELKEVVQPLSADATKGFLNTIDIDPTGTLRVTYKMKVKKKSDDISYEDYSFDKDLKFTGSQQAQEPKSTYEDYERTSYIAYVGGTTSFDVLSMKLKIFKIVQLMTWDRAHQYYEVKKTISKEDIKPKNDDGKVYMGYASYNSRDPKNTDLLVLAKADTKDKAESQAFYILLFNDKLELKSLPLRLGGDYSLVYSGQLNDENDNVIMIFAPREGTGDIAEYIYLQYDLTGNEVYRSSFKSPASAMIVTDMAENAGNVYFIGSSSKSNKAYEDVFSEYAPIFNPGNTGAGANKVDLKWQKSSEATMENLHLLKFTGNELAMASTTPTKAFKEKFKTVKGDKGASVYKGKKFNVTKFHVTPDEEYFVAGQLVGMEAIGKVYYDLICFHLDKQGNLRAQYGLGRSSEDKKSEIFKVPQNFYPGENGTIYWEVLDAKGIKGYDSFADAYNGVPTFYPQYFPRIVAINLKDAEMTSLHQLGGGKYFLNQKFTGIYNKEKRCITYIGRDLKYKNLWVGQAKL